MAKCPVCNTRKGKRKCAIVNNDFVCSLCCANTRKEELCLACVFYQPPQRDYDAVPAFSTAVIANNHALQNYSQLIKNAYLVDNSQDEIAILELLMDNYYFKDSQVQTDNELWQSGFELTNNVIQNKLPEVDEETLINILGAMRYSAKNQIT